MKIKNIELKTAKEFIALNHRHCTPPVGWKFGCGLFIKDELVGVITAGNPVSRVLCDGRTLEINRSCVLDVKNANSMLYAAVIRAAKALGWRKVITYTLHEESGASLRAVGFELETNKAGKAGTAGGWQSRDGRANNKKTIGLKNRWGIYLGNE